MFVRITEVLSIPTLHMQAFWRMSTLNTILPSFMHLILSLKELLKRELDKRLSEPIESPGFIVTFFRVYDAISKLKKKVLKGS